jgi:hypothetical protein
MKTAEEIFKPKLVALIESDKHMDYKALSDAIYEAMEEYADQMVKSKDDAIEYALGLITNTLPQHRREFYATARAALRKALKTPASPNH